MSSTGWRKCFPAASYQYVLYGMGFRTEVGPMDNADTEALGAQALERKYGHYQAAAFPIAEESRSDPQDPRTRPAAHLAGICDRDQHRRPQQPDPPALRVQAEASAARYGDNQRFVQVVVSGVSASGRALSDSVFEGLRTPVRSSAAPCSVSTKVRICS